MSTPKTVAAGRQSLLKAAGLAPTLPPPTPRRPNRPAGPSTKSDAPRKVAKPTVASPGPHVNLSPKKTTQTAINAKAAAKPKG